MIKFFYFILLSLFTLGVSSYGVWLVNGAWVFVLFCLLINASGLTDFLILTNDFWVDTISFRLVVLRLWVTIIILFSRERIYVRKNFVIYFFLMVRLLLLFLVLAFIRINILTFYFFFWSFFNSHSFNYPGLGVPAWAASSGYLFFILYSYCFTSSFDCFTLLL